MKWPPDLAVALGLTALVQAMPMVRAGGRWEFLPTGFVADDALFYLQIARHIAHGDGSTFNGLVPTNGYHPLWMLVVTAVTAAVGDRTLRLRAVLLVAGLLLAATLSTASATLRRRGAATTAPLAIAVLATGLGATVDWVSEAHLAALLLISLVARALADRPSTRARAGVVDGLLVAGCVLARLDTVGFALAGGIAIFLATRSIPRAGVAVATALAAVAPYFTWNLVRFGHVGTISAALQFHAGSAVFSPSKLAPSGLVAVALAVGTAAALARWETDAAIRRCGLLFLGSAVAHGVAVALFHRVRAYPWYWVQCVVAVGVFAPLGLRHVAARLDAAALPGARWMRTAIVLVPLGLAAARGVHGRSGARLLGIPAAVAAALPAGATVFVDDSPGLVAWFTDLRVVAADGLTADWAYQRSLETEGAPRTLARLGVGWVLHVDDGRAASFDAPPRAWRERYGAVPLRVTSGLRAVRSELWLAQRDEVLRFDAGLDEADRIILWRWTPPVRR